MVFCSVEQAVKELRKGNIVILVDDKNRENEGDLVFAAQKTTKQKISFMLQNCTGIICVPMHKKTAEKLDLKEMVPEKENTEKHKTNFTVSVDAKKGITTGVSASDRAKTIKLLANPKTKPEFLVRPGHVFPLISREGGVLVRAGHTEASTDLMRLARLNPVAVICEIVKPNGEMAKLPYLKKFAKKHGLKILSIAELINYRLSKEKLVKKTVSVKLPTKYGLFTAFGYKNTKNNAEYIALVKGKITRQKTVLVRVHSGCVTGDILGSKKCDCGSQLKKALKKIGESKTGVLVYIQEHEGRGIGLINKLKAYKLQEKGFDTVEANKKLGFEMDLREYGIGAQILNDLKVKKINLLTNNPKKIAGLSGYGLKIVKRTPLIGKKTGYNKKYLETKKTKMGHFL